MDAAEGSVVGYRRLLLRIAPVSALRRDMLYGGNISRDTGEGAHLAQEISMQRLGWDGHPG